MQDKNFEKQYNKKILKKNNDLNIRDKKTTDSIMRLKQRIDSSNRITVKSASLVITRFIKILEDDGKEIFNEEKAKLENFKALIGGCSDSCVLNDNQLLAFEDVWYIWINILIKIRREKVK